ncbi:hypothetical protein P7K49_032685 [Saguinus oedipus]|uniref:DNA-directed RNA polymerase n=1 Tax=Saguinus oedipus TaxID=9490 RepID=A0ABQ9TPT6_SAGOE|nr:hypothetical protein P7K49_032685 [Saguinus oedipus]
MGGPRPCLIIPGEPLTPALPSNRQVCREQFVRLHSEPILQDLSSFLVSRFCCSSRPQKVSQRLDDSKLREMLLAVPKPGMVGDGLAWVVLTGGRLTAPPPHVLCFASSPGAFDLERVKHSTFFFS